MNCWYNRIDYRFQMYLIFKFVDESIYVAIVTFLQIDSLIFKYVLAVGMCQ